MHSAGLSHSVSGVPLSNVTTAPFTTEAHRYQARKWAASQTSNPANPEPILLDTGKASFKVKKEKILNIYALIPSLTHC